MIPLYKPYMPPHLPDLQAILHSGQLAYGKWGKALEQAISDFTGAPHVAVVNSYNAAVQVAFLTLGIGPGDDIITSPQSCLASNMPILTAGANAVWADIDPATGTLDPQSVKSKITPRTKAIFHNHHCGYPGYVAEINAVAKEKGIIVIDDCIEAFGAEYNGRMMGALGTDVTIFSFQTVRLPNTIDGGAVCFNDDELHRKACKMRDLGVDRTSFRDALGEITALSDVPLAGMGVTLNEVSSYIGLQQMQNVPALLAQQRLNGKAWKARLARDSNYRGIAVGRHINPNHWVTGMLYAEGRVAGIEHFRGMGYWASSVHLPNVRYSAFGGSAGALKGVEEFYNHFVAVPSGWWVNENDINRSL